MPTLPDRDDRAAELARIMGRLSRAQLIRLKNAMGQPPDPARIPPAMWLEFQQAAREKSHAWLYATAAAAAGVLGAVLLKDHDYEPDQSALEAALDAWAAARAAELAAGFVGHTQERIEGAAVAFRQGDIDLEELTARIDRTADPVRMDSIGTTEATTAETNGAGIAGGRFEADTGGVALKIWRHRERLESGVHPCPLCAPLVGADESEWGAINPDAIEGPPLHPNCDCTVEVLFISAEERALLPGRGNVAVRGGSQSYADAFKRIRDSRGSRFDK